MAVTDLATYMYHLNGGLRPNQFKVNLAPPPGLNMNGEKFAALVAAANLPMMNVGMIQKKKRGRQIKLSGDTEPSGQWTMRLDLNSGSEAAHALHLALQWQQLARNIKNPSAYKSNGVVEMIDATIDAHTGSSALKAEVIGVWVANVVEIQLDDESVDEVSSFEMTLEYDDVIYL